MPSLPYRHPNRPSSWRCCGCGQPRPMIDTAICMVCGEPAPLVPLLLASLPSAPIQLVAWAGAARPTSSGGFTAPPMGCSGASHVLAANGGSSNSAARRR